MAKNKLHLLLKLESEKEETLRMSYLQANQNYFGDEQAMHL